MKLLKYGFVLFLLSMMMVACGDDSTTDPDGDPVLPTSKVIVTTMIDGSEMDRRVVEGKDGEYTPSNYQLSGFYTNVNGLFNMIIVGDTGTEETFSVNLLGVLTELKTGTYNLGADTDEDYGSYRNSKFGDDSYNTSSINLAISKVDFISIIGTSGLYFISGNLSMELENEYNENPNVTVNVAFQNFQITSMTTGF